MTGSNMLSTISHRGRSLYRLYYYSLPIPVLSKAETYALNAFNMMMMMFFLYYLFFVLPHTMKHAIETLYYYITGNSISFNLTMSVVALKAYSSIVEDGSQTESTKT